MNISKSRARLRVADLRGRDKGVYGMTCTIDALLCHRSIC